MKRHKKYLLLLTMPFLLTSPVYADPDTTETEVPSTEQEGPAFPEDMHGEIYNAENGVFLFNGNTRAEEVTQAIENLTAGSGEQAIREIRYRYNALSMAEKARVPNEDTLYRLEKAYGANEQQVTPLLPYDYEQIYGQEQTEKNRAVSYQFTVSEQKQTLSVTVGYTEDKDRDGKKDVPHLWLKGPDGSMTELTQGQPDIRQSEFHVKTVWTEGMMQVDIVNAIYGTWVLQTDDPVVFTEHEYIGEQEYIPSEEGKTTETQVTQTQEEKKTSKLWAWGKLGLFAAGAIGLFVFLNLWGKKKNPDGEKTAKTAKTKGSSNRPQKPQVQNHDREDDIDPMDTEAMKQALREAIGITDEQTEPAAQPQKETRQEQPAYTPPQQQPQTPIKTFDIPLQEATDIAENSDVLYWDGTTASGNAQAQKAQPMQPAQPVPPVQPTYTPSQTNPPVTPSTANTSMDDDDDGFLDDF